MLTSPIMVRVAHAGVLASLLTAAPAVRAQSPYGQPAQQPSYPQSSSAPYGQQQQGYAQPYGQQPANQQPGLEAGGLTPPSATEEDPQSVHTERELERAEREDSGRGLEFIWLNAEFGFEHLGLETFSADNLGLVQTSQTGLVYGAGLGLRLVFITAGVRFRVGSFDAWQLWTLDAEVGLRIPIGQLEPYLLIGGGYASLGSFGSDNIGGGLNSDNVDVTGYNIRFGGGLDYYVTPVFSVGASLTGDLLGLSRPGVDLTDVQDAASEEEALAADGSGLGFGVTGSLVLGLHF